MEHTINKFVHVALPAELGRLHLHKENILQVSLHLLLSEQFILSLNSETLVFWDRKKFGWTYNFHVYNIHYVG